MTFQAVATLSNRDSLCICEITDAEAEVAMQENPDFDGVGLYLVAVDAQAPRNAGRVLAKFANEDCASTLAKFFRTHGALVAA